MTIFRRGIKHSSHRSIMNYEQNSSPCPRLASCRWGSFFRNFCVSNGQGRRQALRNGSRPPAPASLLRATGFKAPVAWSLAKKKKKKARSYLSRFFLPATYAPFAFKPSALRNHAGGLAKGGRPHPPAPPLAPLPRARAFCPRSRSFCPCSRPCSHRASVCSRSNCRLQWLRQGQKSLRWGLNALRSGQPLASAPNACGRPPLASPHPRCGVGCLPPALPICVGFSAFLGFTCSKRGGGMVPVNQSIGKNLLIFFGLRSGVC